jgi:hypothetical protein
VRENPSDGDRRIPARARVPGGRRHRAHPAGQEGQRPLGRGGAVSRARRRYERQGILVEQEALERAEQECLADEHARERRRARDAVRREAEDAGRALDARAVELAVIASIRHEDTGYGALLMRGVGRAEARDLIRAEVDDVLDGWRQE